MGFFGAVRDLNAQAKELQKNSDPGRVMRDAHLRLASASAMIADQTAAAHTASVGVDIMVTITGLRQVGMVGCDPMIELDLIAMPDELPPYPVSVQRSVNLMQLPWLQAGVELPAKVDPNDPSTIWLDLSGLT
jgi:hypothetical protein